MVHDVEAAVAEYWNGFGIGPWRIFDYPDCLAVVRGVEQRFGLRVALTKLDDGFEWELIEPLDTVSIYGQFLAEHGPGVQHIGMKVDDVLATVETVGPLLRSDNAGLRGGVQRYAMLETESRLGVVAEVMDYSDDWVRPGYVATYPPDADVSAEIVY